MMNALTLKHPPDYTRAHRIKSIQKKETIIYWIAYLQKKLLQQERLTQCQEKNQHHLRE